MHLIPRQPRHCKQRLAAGLTRGGPRRGLELPQSIDAGDEIPELLPVVGARKRLIRRRHAQKIA